MAILQALFSFLSRSSGKILNALFGWAVTALFGRPGPTEQTLLTVLIAGAAVWPLLVLGAIFPRVFTMALAFIPIPEGFPQWPLRVVWLALALMVPAAIGFVLARRAPGEIAQESIVKRFLRGFPVTIGLAAAIALMLVAVPFLKIAAFVRGRIDVHVPLVSDASTYHEAAALVLASLRDHGILVSSARPPFWIRWPNTILRAMGGALLRANVPERLHYFRNHDLQVTLHPSDLLLRGTPRMTTRAHGLVLEGTAHSRAFQSRDVRSQAIEKEIRRVWDLVEGQPAHVHAPLLESRLREIADEVRELDVDFGDWEVAYRKTLQLSNALGGREPLLHEERRRSEGTMREREEGRPAPSPVPPRLPGQPVRPSEVPTGELVEELVGKVTRLARKEMELAKTELQQNLRSEVAMAKGLGIAGVCALTTLNLLLVALAMFLGRWIPEWGAALLVAAGVLLVGTLAGLWGWSRRVKEPLATTRRTLREDVRWAKERIA